MAVAQGHSQPEPAPYSRPEDIDLTPLLVPRLQDHYERIRGAACDRSRVVRSLCIACFVVGIAAGAGVTEVIRRVADRVPPPLSAPVQAAEREKPVVEVRTLTR